MKHETANSFYGAYSMHNDICTCTSGIVYIYKVGQKCTFSIHHMGATVQDKMKHKMFRVQDNKDYGNSFWVAIKNSFYYTHNNIISNSSADIFAVCTRSLM